MDRPALFLSYSSANRDSVAKIQEFLAARGIRTFLDRDQLIPGLPWPSALEEALRSVRAVVIFIGRELGGWQKREMYFSLDHQAREEKQGRSFPVIPILLPGADLTPSFLFLNTWIDLRARLDSAAIVGPLAALERAISSTAPVLKLVAEPAVALCPYRGLEAFHEEHAAFFSGRTSFAAELLKFTLGKDLVTVVGPSGSGKSSVVQAGLVLLLRRQLPPETTWDVITFTPGTDPFLRFASSVTPLLESGLSETDRLKEAQKLGDGIAKKEIRIESVIDRLLAKSNGTGRLLVVADQFEELFTLTPESMRRSFAIGLIHALGKANFTLLITLRADFYSHVIALDRELSDRLAPSQVNIGALTGEELRESITLPAKLVGLEFEPGLVDRILHDVGNQPGNLPLLEFALTGLWSKRHDGMLLTNRAYNEIGGVTGALAQLAEAEFARFVPEEQTAVRRLFSRLVRVARPGEGADDTRQRIELQAVDAHTERVVQVLAGPELRLLVTGNGQNDSRTVEIAHEALIRRWERLRCWIAEDHEFLLWRQRIRVQVDQWAQHGQEASYLLWGSSLAEAERWLVGHIQDLMADEQQFIRESIGLREWEHKKQELRRKTELVRLRWFSSVLAIMLMIALGAAWFARRQQVIADSRSLAAQAEETSNRDQPGALNLALKAVEAARTIEAYTAVAKAFPQLSVTLEGHADSIVSAVFSPDGKRIVTASFDHTARVWNASSGQLLAMLQGHADHVRSAVFSPDGQRILTASDDNTARVWNAGNGQLLAMLRGHTNHVLSAVFSPDGQRIVTGSVDETARVWNTGRGQLLVTLQGHTDTVRSAVFSPDGQRIVTASDDATARAWNADSGQLLTTLVGHTAEVLSAMFSPDGQRIVTASDDKIARVWNADRGQLLATLEGHTAEVLSAVFSPDGQRIVTASRDERARLWNANSGQRLLATLEGHIAEVLSAVFSPDGQRIVTAGDDNTARIWDADSGQPLATLRGHTAEVSSAVFSPNGQRIVTASSDHTARVWSAASGQLLTTLQGHTDHVRSAMFSPDGQRILTASDDNTARVWNAGNGQPLATLKGHTDHLISAVFSPDGKRMLTASDDHTVRVWDTGNGQLLGTLRGHTDHVRSAVFSPDGTRILTASDDHTARVWNSSNGELLATLRGHTDHVRSAVFSPDCKRIVTASSDRTARVWGAASGQLLATLQGQGLIAEVLSAVFSPNGELIVTASSDRTARVWNSNNGELLATLQGHTDQVLSAVFSPDGQRIVTASIDKTARVFRVVTLSEIEDLLAR